MLVNMDRHLESYSRCYRNKVEINYRYCCVNCKKVGEFIAMAMVEEQNGSLVLVFRKNNCNLIAT